LSLATWGDEDELGLGEGPCPDCDCCDQVVVRCWRCGGEGGDDAESLMEEDPLWHGPDDFRTCDICAGEGSFRVCGSRCEDGEHPEQPLAERSPTWWARIPLEPVPDLELGVAAHG
jgi:hypothetical protein